MPDGQFQTYAARDAAYIREHFFGTRSGLAGLAKLADRRDRRGLAAAGHEPRKVYAAYRAASTHQGRADVILAQTVKGWTLGRASSRATPTTR